MRVNAYGTTDAVRWQRPGRKSKAVAARRTDTSLESLIRLTTAGYPGRLNRAGSPELTPLGGVAVGGNRRGRLGACECRRYAHNSGPVPGFDTALRRSSDCLCPLHHATVTASPAAITARVVRVLRRVGRVKDLVLLGARSQRQHDE